MKAERDVREAEVFVMFVFVTLLFATENNRFRFLVSGHVFHPH